jgi:NADP-dependent 3-hydroxy acid dehydrogenase YdfG
MFGKEQANLYLLARRKDRLQELADKFPNVKKIYAIDLTEEESVKYVFTDLKEQGVKLDTMIYCAGKADNAPMSLYDRTRFQDMMNINVFPFLEAMKFFLSKKYSADGGSVVVVSSLSTKRAEIGRGEYTASKGAIDAVLPVLAKEAVKRKIRVNAVSPAFVNTELYEEMRQSFDVESLVNEQQPLGLVEPESVAEAILFLASEKTKYTTGRVFDMDAGALL